MRLFWLAILAVAAYACTAQARPLKPVRPTPLPTEPFSLVIDEAQQVTFAQIEANPTLFVGQSIRVQGNYVPFEPLVCFPFQGPSFEWGLIADNLQMNARGFEQIVELLADGQPLLLDGVWRQYVGPAGCGKEPASRVIYYLDVREIVQPNPISRVFVDQDASVAPPVNEQVATPDVDSPLLPTETPQPIIEIATLAPSTGGGGYPVGIPTLTPSQAPIPTQTSTLRPRPTRTPRPLQPTNTPSQIETATIEPTATTEARPTEESATPTPQQTDAPPPTPTLFSRETPRPGTPTPTADATRPLVTETPTVTGTPPTATPTSTGTITVTPDLDVTPTATPEDDDDGLITATPDPNATPEPLPTRDDDYPYP